MSISNCLFFHSLTAYQYLQSGRKGVAFPAIISPSTIRSQGQASALMETITSPPRDRREGLENEGKSYVSFSRRGSNEHWEIPTSEKRGANHTLELVRKASFLGTVSTERVFKSSLSSNSFPSTVQQGAAQSAESAHNGGCHLWQAGSVAQAGNLKLRDSLKRNRKSNHWGQVSDCRICRDCPKKRIPESRISEYSFLVLWPLEGLQKPHDHFVPRSCYLERPLVRGWVEGDASASSWGMKGILCRAKDHDHAQRQV